MMQPRTFWRHGKSRPERVSNDHRKNYVTRCFSGSSERSKTTPQHPGHRRTSVLQNENSRSESVTSASNELALGAQPDQVQSKKACRSALQHRQGNMRSKRWQGSHLSDILVPRRQVQPPQDVARFTCKTRHPSGRSAGI